MGSSLLLPGGSELPSLRLVAPSKPKGQARDSESSGTGSEWKALEANTPPFKSILPIEYFSKTRLLLGTKYTPVSGLPWGWREMTHKMHPAWRLQVVLNNVPWPFHGLTKTL